MANTVVWANGTSNHQWNRAWAVLGQNDPDVLEIPVGETVAPPVATNVVNVKQAVKRASVY